MTEHKKNVDFSHITVNFRWILPIMIGGYIVAWTVNTNWQNQRFDKLEAGQGKVWQTLTNFKDDTNKQFIEVYKRIH